MGAGAFSSEEGTKSVEVMIGFELDGILEQWSTVQPFLLDLGDEALQLKNELGQGACEVSSP